MPVSAPNGVTAYACTTKHTIWKICLPLSWEIISQFNLHLFLFFWFCALGKCHRDNISELYWCSSPFCTSLTCLSAIQPEARSAMGKPRTVSTKEKETERDYVELLNSKTELLICIKLIVSKDELCFSFPFLKSKLFKWISHNGIRDADDKGPVGDFSQYGQFVGLGGCEGISSFPPSCHNGPCSLAWCPHMNSASLPIISFFCLQLNLAWIELGAGGWHLSGTFTPMCLVRRMYVTVCGAAGLRFPDAFSSKDIPQTVFPTCNQQSGLGPYWLILQLFCPYWQSMFCRFVYH